MKDLSVHTLLDQLEAKQHLKARNQAEAFILCTENQDELPIYIHVLLGFGAFMGCICVIGLVSATGWVDWSNHSLLMILGLISIALAIGINHLLQDSTDLLHSFSLQLSCILIFFGKILFVWGFTHLLQTWLPTMNHAWLVTISIALIVIPTYFLYPIMLDRFLSSFVLLCAIWISTLTYENNQAFYASYVVLLIVVGYLANTRNKHHHLEALFFASLAALGCCAVYLIENPNQFNYYGLHIKDWSVPIILFNITLAIAVILQSFTIKVKPPRNNLIFASSCIALLVLGIISTNAILYGIGVMLVGYEKHRRSLIIGGAVFLAVFIIHYYYSLSFSLVHKSAILVGSGTLLLLARMVLQHEHWDKHHD